MTVSTSETDPDRQTEPRSRFPRWLNWVLALLTVPAAGLVVIVATGAVMSVAACSTVQCPDLGLSGLLFNVMFYGAPAVAVVTILATFFTAAKRWGIVVPLIGWALLLADVVALTVAFNT
ncbi:hypothetical protein MKOR_20870 [Mycolicibacillus koreensis]|nr:hypothetical protein [Mycolicibacillus koreensis]BBY54836.1 hypothetical protein MKOR_20870 [Mycolicibacillus koreensis]